jgi:hypothetical protein
VGESLSSATPFVWLEVDTLQEPGEVAAAAAPWMDEVYRQTLIPLAERVGVGWLLEQTNDSQSDIRDLRRDKDWTDALALLLKEGAQNLVVDAAIEDPSDGRIYQQLGLGTGLHSYHLACWLRLRLAAGLPVEEGWPAFQERLLRYFVAAAEAVSASTGFISNDSGISDDTPLSNGKTRYEDETHMRSGEVLEQSDRVLRGVFWCNLLSRGHLERLGGIERVEREAPVAQTRRLRSRNGPLLLLQATDDLRTFDSGVLERLTDFLVSALPQKRSFPDEAPPQPTRSEPTVEIDQDVDADVVLQLIFKGEVADDDRAVLDDLLDSWYVLAVHSVFGSPVHNMAAPEYEPAGQTSQCSIEIDLGNSGFVAIEPLTRLLVAAHHEFRAPLLHIRVRAE